jgi:hypothetical protein
LAYKVSKCIYIYYNFRDSVMALNNRIVHKVFRTIAYTKWIDFEVIFWQEYFEVTNVINYLPH